VLESLSMTATAQLFLSEREKLLQHFQHKLETAHHLNRRAVSFQANKTEPIYRWFKYKEGFSSSLVKRFLTEYSPTPGKLLDPFAGAGTSLFAGEELGWQTSGIELLPVGAFAVRARQAITRTDAWMLAEAIQSWGRFSGPSDITFNHLKITKHAFPIETEKRLNRYLSFCKLLEDSDVQTAMRFAAFSILEQISYTRKDGQYLRWDHRSDRTLSGKPFDKGFIPSFDEAIQKKFDEILADAVGGTEQRLFESDDVSNTEHPMQLVTGSCLNVLPVTDADQFDFVITSPPYCNRYDYTRTYALELAFLGLDDDDIRELRQELLSCTVENKDKVDRLRTTYANIGRLTSFDIVMREYESSEAMSEVNIILEKLKNNDQLNNKNIARMVRNYFLEMCFVTYELARVTRPGGYCVMVNDNVRYGGEEIPADLILSEFAQAFGYNIDKILVLPRGKGNSSQQMGEFGRSEIRKCVYVWRRAR
jgi:DNA modification methylase